MKTVVYTFLVTILISGCNFSKSVKKDLLSGLTAKGDVLSCDEVYLTVNDEKTNRSSFVYGETFYIHYSDIQGFTKENGFVFPAMEMIITDKSGDTLLYSDDLYKGKTEGFNYSPLELKAHLTVATPIKSGGDYSMFVNISDKKGPGTYKSKFDFKVRPNERILTEPAGVTFNEAYLYSQGNDKVILDGKIKFDDNIYIIVEGLRGLKEENGLVYPGLSLKATDAGNNIVLNYDDLFADYSNTGVSSDDFASRVSSHFKLTGSGFNNPLHCEAIIWDKKSDSKLKITTDMTVE
jgi:hypothetical protein